MSRDDPFDPSKFRPYRPDGSHEPPAATPAGGAVYCTGSSPTFTHCVFRNHSADVGGAVYCDNGASPTFANCVFTGNEAALDGGTFYVEAAGLVKFDFLGLKTLTVLAEALKLVNQARARLDEDPIDLIGLPLDEFCF